MYAQTLTDQEFSSYQRFIFEAAGIMLSAAKKALVVCRLAKRLHLYQLSSFTEYFKLLTSGSNPAEVQVAVDLLTTNETYFFREERHFDFLRERALAARGRASTFRVWSAASSSGEEAYSIAMILADCLGENAAWEVFGSDISTQVLQSAKRGQYALARSRHIPDDYLERFCRIGTDEYKGTFLIDRKLRNRVSFLQLNLNESLPNIGQFDVVFLRNVLIYFNRETKRSVVERVTSKVKPDGYFFVGHSESLCEARGTMQLLAPSVYRKAC
ncbi:MULTISPECIES: CheR family methyltransferase [Giesbergeria]|uniref:Chemotaxis protein methyltransferase n=1 Tax=Giesbergeria sinuosa TaxID=80883 RepID=A0ABV9QEG2_9BURK